MTRERKHIEELKRLAMQYADRRISKVRMLKTMHALCDSALAACDESPWRSMESAPKDGTDIMLAAPGRVTCGEWIVPNTPEWDDDPFWGSWGGNFSEENPPTHWMPLPAAPDGEKP